MFFSLQQQTHFVQPHLTILCWNCMWERKWLIVLWREREGANERFASPLAHLVVVKSCSLIHLVLPHMHTFPIINDNWKKFPVNTVFGWPNRRKQSPSSTASNDAKLWHQYNGHDYINVCSFPFVEHITWRGNTSYWERDLFCKKYVSFKLVTTINWFLQWQKKLRFIFNHYIGLYSRKTPIHSNDKLFVYANAHFHHNPQWLQ